MFSTTAVAHLYAWKICRVKYGVSFAFSCPTTKNLAVSVLTTFGSTHSRKFALWSFIKTKHQSVIINQHVPCSILESGLLHSWRHRPLNGPVCHLQVRPGITRGHCKDWVRECWTYRPCDVLLIVAAIKACSVPPSARPCEPTCFAALRREGTRRRVLMIERLEA